MFTLSSYISITDPTGQYFIDNFPIINVEINKSRRTLTNTATIELPRKVVLQQQGKPFNFPNVDVNTIVQRGAKVVIQIGYDGNLTTEFTGYVSSVSAQAPFTIKCQDDMWLLKQNTFTKTWTNVKVADIVSYIYTGTAQVVDLTIGGLLVVKQSTAQILEGLKKFGLYAYFNNDVLIVDFASVVHSTGQQVNYDFSKNVQENKLDYKLKEDSRIKVIGVSKLPNGKKYEIVAGDSDGEVHTLHYFNLQPDQLQLIVNAEINHLKYEGYKGYFKSWGIPLINPGDIAFLHDPIYPERDGYYLTEQVKTSFGIEGFRREVYPEISVSS